MGWWVKKGFQPQWAKSFFSKIVLKNFKTIFQIFKRIENDFSNSETQRKKTFQKIPKRIEKKKRFQI